MFYEASHMPKKETIYEVCELFILLFDTLPIYNSESYTSEEWRLALTAKNIAALILNRQLMYSITNIVYIHRYRHKKFLDFSADRPSVGI